MSPQFLFLDEAGREALAAAAFELLQRVGVKVTEPEARALLAGAGARIDGDWARMPAPLLESALHTAPSTVDLYFRDGRPALRLGGHEAHFGAHTDAPAVHDPGSSRRRPCLEADVARHARLVDALPEIAFLTGSGLVADRPAAVGDRVALACCLEGSVKPVLSMPVTLDGLRDCHHLASLAVGGTKALLEHPLMVVYAEPVSPLVHPDESLRKLLYCARQGIPLVYSGFAAMGGTAPQSPAAIVAQLCAESLSGLVIHQLAAPGAPFIFGGMASAMDMKTATFSYGAPEFQRGNTLLAEMAHHFKVPNFGTAGTSDSQVVDGQAILEVTSSCIMALLSGAGLVHDVGLLGSATVIMPEMIVATAEIVAMVRRVLGDVSLTGDDWALDVLEEVGPGGEFVTHAHTLRHFRHLWYPALLYRGGSRRWEEGSVPPFDGRLNERTRELLDRPAAVPLPEATLAQMDRVIAEAEARHR